MNKEELNIIIQKGEGYRTEFKRSVNNDLQKELVAFANASGGKIYIGIDDNGSITGIENSNKLKSKIQSLANSCDPAVPASLDSFKNILIIDIPEGKEKPYRCTNGFYLRTGASSQKMGTGQIREFMQSEGVIKFDEILNPRAEFEKEFDEEKLDHFLKLANISKNIPIVDLLLNLNTISVKNGKPIFNNAGVLFFTKNPSIYLPQSTVVCAIFKGTGKVNILDKKEFSRDIISNIESAILYLKNHLKTEFIIETTRRKEVLELPEKSFREAIINAVAHRDYFEKGVHVTIEIYDDRVEIFNYGGLPKGFPKGKFGKKSFPRNSTIVSLLNRTDYIEKMGTGIERIRNEMKNQGLPKPIFDIDTFFTVVFKREIYVPEHLKPTITDQVSSEGFGKNSERIRKEFGEDIGKAFEILLKNPRYTADQIATEINKSSRTVENYISKLKNSGYIKRKGPKLGGYWKIQ